MIPTRRAVADLPGWAEDDHAAALAAFRRSARRITSDSDAPAAWRAVAAAALAVPDAADAATARAFFEASFDAYPVEPSPAARPFLTGYYEPELAGSRAATSDFTVPLYARPDDLVDVTDANRPAGIPGNLPFARLSDSGLTPYHDRAAIEDGALAGRGLELVHLADAVDAYFVHVQGSCRVRLDDGAVLRLAYAAKAGHPYTSIGRLLVERGVIPADTMTGAVLAAWLRANPAEGRALMRENRSYVFFAEQTGLDPDLGAIGAGGVQLTPGRSLAVDHAVHRYGAPVWLDAALPLGTGGALRPFRRLMIAQDTGSAIVGPARGDVFIGCGAEAERIAGGFRHNAEAFVVFVPKPNRV
jgi:membrane-bound lytic murein transglycosylase A